MFLLLWLFCTLSIGIVYWSSFDVGEWLLFDLVWSTTSHIRSMRQPPHRIASAAATGDVELCSTYASSHLNHRIARHVFRHENAWRFLIETHTSENSVKCTTIMNNFWTVFFEQNLPVNYKFPLRELQLCFDLMYLSVFLRLFLKLPIYKWVRGLIEYSSA